MWMNVYLQDILLREGMADAQRRAAIYHLLRGAKPPPSVWERIARRLRDRAPAAPESARLVERPVN